ncbi:hypothetical protein EVG20_g876 [Dentipellis fragilis]|uniref:Uncharacterized protein n=1 Tax=Dentipellis fragilis TaxID=205917 RepID=A0A4Y9ZBB6_9AGAM|nr:hypothetical protein EVG20_g876 [Dentipellis fragilis]
MVLNSTRVVRRSKDHWAKGLEAARTPRLPIAKEKRASGENGLALGTARGRQREHVPSEVKTTEEASVKATRRQTRPINFAPTPPSSGHSGRDAARPHSSILRELTPSSSAHPRGISSHLLQRILVMGPPCCLLAPSSCVCLCHQHFSRVHSASLSASTVASDVRRPSSLAADLQSISQPSSHAHAMSRYVLLTSPYASASDICLATVQPKPIQAAIQTLAQLTPRVLWRPLCYLYWPYLTVDPTESGRLTGLGRPPAALGQRLWSSGLFLACAVVGPARSQLVSDDAAVVCAAGSASGAGAVSDVGAALPPMSAPHSHEA